MEQLRDWVVRRGGNIVPIILGVFSSMLEASNHYEKIKGPSAEGSGRAADEPGGLAAVRSPSRHAGRGKFLTRERRYEGTLRDAIKERAKLCAELVDQTGNPYAPVDYETSDGWEDEDPPVLCMKCDRPAERDDLGDLPLCKKHK